MDFERRGQAGELRPYTAAEKFLLVVCFLTPGASAFGLMLAYFVWSWNLSGQATYPGIAFVLPGVAILFGCCFFAGMIVASRQGEENRKARTIQSAIRLLLDQIVFLTLAYALLSTFR